MSIRFIVRRFATAALVTTVAMVSTFSHSVFAYDEASPSALNVDAQGLAIHGYDPVAYFVAKTPTPGKSSITHMYQGTSYRFVSVANRDSFAANPQNYVPQYGGFCAMGVALDKKLDGDPQAWRVVDGKLYLNVNKDVQKKWLEDVPGNLKKAEANWPLIKDKAPKDL